MKVLLMPSWYPNVKQKTGSFFKEQAAFLNDNGFDIKVLMAEELHTRSYMYQLLIRFVTAKSNTLSTHFLDQDPEAFSFPIILQKGWTEQKQIDVANSKYLKAFKELIKTGWVPDLIHVQGAFKAGFSAQYISELYNIPYVVIEHSPFKLAAYSKFRQEKIKKVLLEAVKVAGVSKFQKKRMFEDGIARKIDVVWNFLDENRFQINKTLDKSKFIITTITRPIKVKDVDTFFKAVSQFIDHVTDRSKIEVVIVGHAALNDEQANTKYYDTKAAELGISDVCKGIPFLSRKEVKVLLNKSNVFISTSLNEPYGVAIREAMLSGVPVISTRSGGPEDSINPQTGVLVEIGDSNSISKYLFEIYKGSLAFDSEYIRNYVISQSGRAAFLNSMTKFYSIEND
ncbi:MULTISPECIES: glycosyltransferase [Flavobacteriaceae]|uniref:glycosyltransferase n=1 Tax=Flavobacteriaceae TaxID=49546 RepID=UPI003A94EEA4